MSCPPPEGGGGGVGGELFSLHSLEFAKSHTRRKFVAVFFVCLVQIIPSDHILWHFVFAIKSLICHLKLLNLIFISLFAKEKSPRPTYQLNIKISNQQIILHVNKNAGYFV